MQGDLVSREVWRGKETVEKGLDGWEPEGLIWPTWPGGLKRSSPHRSCRLPLSRSTGAPQGGDCATRRSGWRLCLVLPWQL